MQMMSPRDLASVSGWPETRIRRLVAQRRLRHVKVGALIMIPENAIEEFLKNNMVLPCQDNHPAPDLFIDGGSPIGSSVTSTRNRDGKKTYQ